MARSKEKTYEQAAAMQDKAIRFLRNVVGDDEKADEIEALSVEEYADRKGLILSNPAPASESTSHQRSTSTMADQDTRTKDQILDNEDAALSLLDDIWNRLLGLDEDSSQDDLADGVGEVCEMINDFDPERFPMDEGAGEEGEQEDVAA
jgi:hypothetical protein